MSKIISASTSLVTTLVLVVSAYAQTKDCCTASACCKGQSCCRQHSAK